MPTISSISGTFGYGRGPQIAPTPGIQIYSPNLTAFEKGRSWNFASNGAFIFDANVSTSAGNCFVITPNANFSVNVKIWGAGGGSTVGGVTTDFITNSISLPSASRLPNYATSLIMAEVGDGAPVPAGAGGAVYGTIDLQAGQPYTVFVGGQPPTSSTAGGGGAASGILEGNIYIASAALDSVAIAGGGGGSPPPRTNNDPTKSKSTFYFLSGAGGGNEAGLATNLSIRTLSSTLSGAGGVGISSTLNLTGMPIIGGEFRYWGGVPTSIDGGGGGGFRGGTFASGGQGNVSINQPALTTQSGAFSIAARYDDPQRNGAGDSDKLGRMIIYLDEYKTSNIVATGGTVTSVPIPGQSLAYQYHTFDNSDKFIVTSADKTDTIDVFVVGGGGGATEECGGGGGGVAFKSALNVTPGTYLATVGHGGDPNLDFDFSQLSNVSGVYVKGGVWGGEKGQPSAFFTNSLSRFGFPDKYFVLIHSFGGKIRYINANGDNTDGLTTTTGYTTFQTALSRNLNDKNLIVFVVLQGTYSETVGTNGNAVPTPIHDQNKPRIFVCSPGRVTIDWTTLPSTSADPNRASPMCQLMHPMSAVYGAIFNRNGYLASDTTSSRMSDLAFFNFTSAGFSGAVTNSIFRGSVYNCVFKEASGDWGLFGTSLNEWMSFTIQNCTFVTTKNDVALTSTGVIQTNNKIVVKDCIFQKSIGFSRPTIENTAQNAAIGAKFVVTAHPDKGVYGGEYRWDSPITTPVTGSRSVAIVGHGGGGGTWHPFLGLARCAGGSGGGTTMPAGRAPSTQFNKNAGMDYSCYGYAGGSVDYETAVSMQVSGTYGPFTTVGSSGGGAGFHGPDVSIIGGQPIVDGGGVGIEFPAGSGIFYGTGGSGRVRGAFNSRLIRTEIVALGVPTSNPQYPYFDYGRGGHAGFSLETITNATDPDELVKSIGGVDPEDPWGRSGIVIVRYIVPGPFTPVVPPTEKNIVAYGGIVTEKLS